MIQKIDFSPLGKAKRVLSKDRKQDKIWDKKWRKLCGEFVAGAKTKEPLSSSVVATLTEIRTTAKVVNINTARRR